jgi:enamine deaminase RidA (YjgF/YER057c/UK114 family)
MGAEQRIKELGLELPPPPQPIATFSPAVRTGNLLFVSGHGPMLADESFIEGEVGESITFGEAQSAARLVGLGMLATIRASLGSLDEVERVVKIFGMVRGAPEFDDQPGVMDGFSDLMVEVFGPERGTGARSAIGTASLPFGIPVEIEAIFEVRG